MAKLSKRTRKGKCVYPFPTYQATFADGMTVRLSVWQPDGKPWDFEHARESARIAWQEQEAWDRIRGDNPKDNALARKWWTAPRREAPAVISAFIEHRTLGRFRDPLDVVPVKAKRTTVKDVKAALADVLAYLDGKHHDAAAIEAARELAA